MNIDQIISRLRALQPRLEAEGVRHLAIVGSRARGEERPDSDLDLLLDLDPDAKVSLLDVIGVEMMSQNATGITANAFLRRSLKDSFVQSFRRDAIEVF